ncbi:MAG: sugar phosphate isomerase/epimerase [Clostridia bacterium]|nr:sugar phosphate isomerase/epimerase [Clostridia bacterium]
MEIGVQFFTLRDYCKNLDDFAESLKKVADIGYKNVQISAVCDYEPEWLAEQLKKNGLKCVVTHTPVPQLTEDAAKVCRNHEIFGCDYVGLGYHDFSLTREGAMYKDFVEKYAPIIKTIKENGKTFMYHNHAKEFLRLDNGNFILEQMAEDFAADELGFILDTFWVQAGGGDPAAWIEKFAGRLPVIHLKDYKYNESFKEFGDNIAVVGEGNINFDRVFEKAETSGVKYMLVEQDNCHGENPFDCVKRSYDYLKSCGF